MINSLKTLISLFSSPTVEGSQHLPFELKESFHRFQKNARSINGNDIVKTTKFIAVDFETTGLTAKDQIISMGFCPISDGVIKLSKCEHIIINADRQPSKESVVIHGITHDQIELGISPASALLKFVERCDNSVIIAHYHKIERQFAQSLAKQIGDCHLDLNIIDTFQLAKSVMERRQQAITPSSLRLFNLRKAYHLPFYKAHNALEDAISTAELFLAQIAKTNTPTDKLTLHDLGLFKYRN